MGHPDVWPGKDRRAAKFIGNLYMFAIEKAGQRGIIPPVIYTTRSLTSICFFIGGESEHDPRLFEG
jgi:hypothetical protein